MVARTGLSSKDFIAPTSFDFREGKGFKMGRTIGAVSFLQILAPELKDRMLADFLEMDSNITVNFHIRTIDQDVYKRQAFVWVKQNPGTMISSPAWGIGQGRMPKSASLLRRDTQSVGNTGS